MASVEAMSEDDPAIRGIMGGIGAMTEDDQ